MGKRIFSFFPPLSLSPWHFPGLSNHSTVSLHPEEVIILANLPSFGKGNPIRLAMAKVSTWGLFINKEREPTVDERGTFHVTSVGW